MGYVVIVDIEDLLPQLWRCCWQKALNNLTTQDSLAEESCHTQGHAPFPAAHIQWLINEWTRVQPTHPNSGELRRVTPSSDLSAEMIEVFFGDYIAARLYPLPNPVSLSSLSPVLIPKAFFNKSPACWSPSRSLLPGKPKQRQWVPRVF